MGFSDRLKEYRKYRGLTQQKVADALGIDKTTYSGYETGKREPDVSKIKALASLFGVSGDELLEIDIGGTNSFVGLQEHQHIKKIP